MPSISTESKLKTAIVPSDETAYSVSPSADLCTGQYCAETREHERPTN